jgi:hypothetical protein
MLEVDPYKPHSRANLLIHGALSRNFHQLLLLRHTEQRQGIPLTKDD